MFTAQHIVNVGSQSIIQDQDKILHNVAQSYVTRGSQNIPKHLSSKQVLLFGSSHPLPSTLPTSHDHIFPVSTDQMFGGELPSNSSGLHDRITIWHQIGRKVCNSLFTAVAEFGPKAKALISV
jgi:hypothetical protein